MLAAKRATDIGLSLLMLIILLPLIAVVALLVRLGLGSPVLFRQCRTGLYRRPFTIYKFRTMTGTRNSVNHLLDDQERLTSLGRYLRSLSLDELPELVNVLRGDMSLVGPRPLLTRYLDRYDADQMRRHEVKPGITGWAQVNGRNAMTWEQRFALDVWYVDHLSLRLDMKILLWTLWRIMTREGVSHPGQATMEEFQGNSISKTGPQTQR